MVMSTPNGQVVKAERGRGWRLEIPSAREVALQARVRNAQGRGDRSLPESPFALLGRRFRSMVVDDEEAVLLVTCVLLRKLGSVAWGLTAGLPARDLLVGAVEPPVDLLILDVMLRDVSGDRLFEEVRYRHPTLPILLVSGLANRRAVGASAWLDPYTRFLPKPFGMQQLAGLLR